MSDKTSEKPDLVSTAFWSIWFGALVVAISFIQLGEAIYSFSEISQRDDEIAAKMYYTSLQQVVMACSGLFIGILGVVLWKNDTIDRSMLIGFGLVTFFTSGYVLAVLFQQRIVMVDFKRSPERELRSYSKRTSDVIYGDVVLFGLVFTMALMMLWLGRYGDNESE